MSKGFVAVFVIVASLSAAPAVAATWQRESSDSWIWADTDSARNGDDGLTYYTVAIGCNSDGGMPATGADGVTSPAQCMFGTPMKRAANCKTGEVYYYRDPDPDPDWGEPGGWEKLYHESPADVMGRFPCNS